MELIAAVYDDWGIGRNGTQPIALAADRKFFRETTRGAAVVAGRKTVEDFPGRNPLPGRVNFLLSRSGSACPGFTVCRSVAELLENITGLSKVFVIGGGSIYAQLLPLCNRAYITKVHAAVESDTFLLNLDNSPDWTVEAVLQSGTENGISYEMYQYRRVPEEAKNPAGRDG